MPKAYDLRRKVIEAVEMNGMTPTQTSQLFGISRNTVDEWLNLKEETGDLKARPRYSGGHSHKSIDWQQFEVFVRENSGKTQE